MIIGCIYNVHCYIGLKKFETINFLRIKLNFPFARIIKADTKTSLDYSILYKMIKWTEKKCTIVLLLFFFGGAGVVYAGKNICISNITHRTIIDMCVTPFITWIHTFLPCVGRVTDISIVKKNTNDRFCFVFLLLLFCFFFVFFVFFFFFSLILEIFSYFFIKVYFIAFLSKTISNDQELIQSDPIY